MGVMVINIIQPGSHNFKKTKWNLKSDGWYVISYNEVKYFFEDADKFLKEIVGMIFNKYKVRMS